MDLIRNIDNNVREKEIEQAKADEEAALAIQQAENKGKTISDYLSDIQNKSSE